MSNYSKLTNFTAKDSLPTGDSNKLIKGSEIDSELVAISAAINTKANTAAPAFTGAPTAPTAALGTSTGQLATTTFVANAVAAVSTLSAFTIVEDGTNLLFKYNGTAVARLTSAGAFSVIDNVTAYDTI
tara:strand:+ start:165 stop:551 length:387 start_codon:yes stop_codon:yes gene_type:complete